MHRCSFHSQGYGNECPKVAAILDVCAALVLDLFQQASQPNAGSADMERCKSWLHLLLNTIEDVARIIPTHHIGWTTKKRQREESAARESETKQLSVPVLKGKSVAKI